MAVKVLRIIEYTYVDYERAEQDMKRWTPAINTRGMTMKSATFMPEYIDWEEPINYQDEPRDNPDKSQVPRHREVES